MQNPTKTLVGFCVLGVLVANFFYLYIDNTIYKLRSLFIILPLFFVSKILCSQDLITFKSGNKYGVKQGETAVIEPQYDTIFGFDPSNRVCLVGNFNAKRSASSLTKKKEYDYFYVNNKNRKLYFHPTASVDSTCDVIINKQTLSQYQTFSDLFVAHIKGKRILANKNGKQISSSYYDNIVTTRQEGFYAVEMKDEKTGQSFWGLINAEGKQIVPLGYSKVTCNIYDSVIFCCTSGIKYNGSDDIYTYQGGKIHTSSKHIHCASKNYAIYRMFESENAFVIMDLKENKEKNLKAEYVYYLKNDRLAILDDDWFFYDLKTDKRTAFDKKLVKALQLE